METYRNQNVPTNSFEEAENEKDQTPFIHSDRKPTLRTYEMLCWHLTGMAGEEKLLAHIGRLQKQE